MTEDKENLAALLRKMPHEAKLALAVELHLRCMEALATGAVPATKETMAVIENGRRELVRHGALKRV